MKLLYRIGYYLLGVSLGMVIVSFVFSGKRTSCNYGPNARVLADLKKKQVVIDSAVLWQENALDSTRFSEMLQRSKVDFSASDTQREGCKRYRLQSNYQDRIYWIDLENCSDKLIVTQLQQP